MAEVIAAVDEDAAECGVEMMRPVYRWKSFWLGVVVLAFLGWAWVRSQELYTYVELSRAGGWGIAVGQERGEIALGFYSVGDGGLHYAEDVQWSDPRWWAWAFRWEGNDNGWYGWVAHWVAVGTWVILWAGWMVWRWRRVRLAEGRSGGSV